MKEVLDFSSMTLEEIEIWDTEQKSIIEKLKNEKNEADKKSRELHLKIWDLQGMQELAKREFNFRTYNDHINGFELTQEHIELLDMYVTDVIERSNEFKNNTYIYPIDKKDSRINKFLIDEGVGVSYPNDRSIKPEYRKTFNTLHLALKEIIKKELKTLIK